MTDTYGKEPHEQPEGVTDDMHGATDAASEPPSDFEFSDDHGHVGTHGDEGDEAAAPAEAAAPRRGLLPVLAVLAGIGVIGAGGAWWFLHQESAPEMPAFTINAPAVNNAPVANVKADQQMEEVAPKIDSISALSPAQEVAAAQPQTAVQAAADAPPKPPVVMPSNQKMVPTLLSPPAAMAALPPPEKIEAAPLPVPAAEAVAPVAAPAAVAPMPSAVKSAAAPAPEQTQRVEALAQRLDAMQKSLDQVAQQLGNVSNMVAAGTPGDGATKDIAARLDKLEQKLAGRSAPAAAPRVAPQPAEVTTTEETSEHAVAAPAAKKAVKKAAPVKKTVAKPSHKPVADQGEPKSSSKWVLRAAAPEQAWVSPTATSRELRPVRIGDTLPGIGRITAIAPDGDGWVVKGTGGTLK